MSLPDIRLQLAAVTLADELNFTRAAERLKITQPALSKQIKELGDRLGFGVFVRDQKMVELTQAGQVFLRGCKDSLAILERAVRSARSMQDNIQPIVTVGHGPYADPSLISALLSVHLPLYPNLRLRMESMFPHELIHSVLSTELDLAIVDDPIENPLLTQVSLTAAPLHAVMASDDPAGKERAVALEDFGGVGWVMFQKRVHPALYDRVLEAASSSGITPAELHHYMSPQEVVQLIRENFGIALMPQGSAKELPRSEIIVRPLRSRVFLITSHLILRADQSSRLVNEFGRAFLKLAIPNATQAEASGQMLLKLQH